MTKTGKYYLGGLDWMIQTMHRSTVRLTGGVGNASQVVLELEGRLDAGSFSETVQVFAASLPILNGRESRDRTLQPYWRISRKTKTQGIRVEVHQVDKHAVFHTLETLLNTPFKTNREYGVFHLIYSGEEHCTLSFVFDHRLLDARGAEQFLLLLSEYMAGHVKPEEAMPEPKPSNVRGQLKEGGLSARSVGETVHKRVIGSGMIRLDERGAYKGNHGRFLVHTLSKEETEAWQEKADREAGYLMFMPYALSAATTAFSKIRSLKNRSGSFIIPCTTDLRPQEFSWKNTFFNYCSIFFFKVDAETAKDHATLIQQFKTQFFNQTKDAFPQKFGRFMGLMRFLPLPLFELMNKWNHASFSFGSVGRSLFDGKTFAGIGIKNLFHMPLLPPQVGMGFFFSQINGRLNMGISWRDGALDEQEVAEVEDAFFGF